MSDEYKIGCGHDEPQEDICWECFYRAEVLRLRKVEEALIEIAEIENQLSSTDMRRIALIALARPEVRELDK